MKMNEQGVPERVASFAGEAFVGELSEASGEGDELNIYHVAGNSNAAMPTAIIDRRPAKDAALWPVKVANLVRPSQATAATKAVARDMARLKDNSPIAAMQARNEGLRSIWNREARR